MAFAIRNLSVLAYANGFTLWHYKTGKDSLHATDSGNYFAEAVDMLSGGDLVMIVASDGAAIRAVRSAEVETVITVPLG